MTERSACLCDLCLKNGMKVAATMFCSDCSERFCPRCVTDHRKFKLLAGHTLWNVSAPKFDFDAIKYTRELIKCDKHPAKNVEYICKDHDNVCCTECVIVRHRKCGDLVSLTEECGNKTGLLKTITKSLERIHKEANCIKAFEEAKQIKVNLSKLKLKEKLAIVKHEFEKAYASLEQKVLAEIEDKSTSIVKNINGSLAKMERTSLDCEEIKHRVKIISEQQNPILDYLLAFKIRKRIKSEKENISVELKEATEEGLKLRENYLFKNLCRNISNCFSVGIVTARVYFDFDAALSSDFVTDDVRPCKRCGRSQCRHSVSYKHSN
ncbi:hypothetical protein ACF0H5_008523 [Mactra antiquata]